MGIASFSPLFSRFGSPGLSFILAPVQTLAAFFTPPQSASVSRHTATYPTAEHLANVQRILKRRPVAPRETACVEPANRLKVMREFEPGMGRSQVGRMVICGRMADVCAELDRIASKASALP